MAATTWKRLNGDHLETGILEAVENTLYQETQNGQAVKVCIGTDSQVKGESIEFATVIVFIRKKNGGFMFLNIERQKNNMTLKERMLTEVYKSLGVAYQVYPLLERYQVEMEIHIDINTNPQFKSNTALSEAMGYIKGMGYTFKAKPDAFASSYCANKVIQ